MSWGIFSKDSLFSLLNVMGILMFSTIVVTSVNGEPIQFLQTNDVYKLHKGFWVVNYHLAGYKYSDKGAKLFTKASKDKKYEKVNFASFNCLDNIDYCFAKGISKFPSITLEQNGRIKSKLQGAPRAVEQIKQFIQK
ncbi:hypothetical protein AX774_g6873 [Zancudomyces culisetae]|uniref:Thioredoxin domain-containing protein n=1 Tax=Zancudomyces culisetae TaxID=1213189 RepID=A0A1R1PFR4_ZANCU|nr:hypothetical protein AX774_g6873 [Zancudomyces culisetae]|eukprot:OMH79702.1 hypothetical protein AX774_g6873 [Zancudomyces culisetae]